MLSQLNTQQYQAVTAPLGTHMVIAGAGSGKTRVITTRIAYLIEHFEVPAYQITALTFTNKAGNEMKERIAQLLSDRKNLPFVGTFHSFCVRLLKRYRAYLPFDTFTIMDSEDQRTLLKKILKSHGLDKHITPARMHGMISFEKNHLPELKKESPEEQKKVPFFNEVYAAYEEEKAAAHALDFDDLLIYALNLLKTHETVRREVQHNAQHVLVDEYQDTNQVQHALLKLLTKEHNTTVAKSVCIVGDEDQSIYSWRGAQADNMQNFLRDYAPVNVIKVEQNYRSVQPILQAANTVISHNSNRNEKVLWSDKKADNRLLLLSCQSGYQEADTIAATIKKLMSDKKDIALHDIALLYRTHNQSRLLEESLMRQTIPYTIVGGIRFYERKEVKDLLAYLRLMVNPFDRTSLFRVINTPNRGLGKAFEELLLTTWRENALLNCAQIFEKLMPQLRPKQQEALSQFAAIFTHITKLAADGVQLTPEQCARHILEKTQYISYLTRTLDPQDAQGKIDNIQELINALVHFEEQAAAQQVPITVEQFLEEVTLMQEQSSGDEQESVRLMTLHAAKGLEFSTVFLAGMEEEVLPSSRALYSSKDLEEERRLCYVGITRAKDYLILSHCATRSTYGTVTSQMRSRFIDEIPTTLYEHIDIDAMPPTVAVVKVLRWFGVHSDHSIMTFGRRPAHFTAHKAPAASPPNRSTHFRRPAPQRAASAQGAWRINTPVHHPSFGIGIVKSVEKKRDEYFLTVAFKTTVKKIAARFVKKQ